MLSIIDNLKESECDLQTSVTKMMPSPTELYSDEMTRSVPSIKSKSSQEFISCVSSSFNSGRRNSRKGRPNRSCSWQDAAPGILFKFNDDSQTILVIPNNFYANQQFENIITEPQQFNSSERKIRSRSITSLSGFSQFQNRSRPRSFSIDCASLKNSSSLYHIPDLSSSQVLKLKLNSNSTESIVNEIDEESFDNECSRPIRKSSVSSITSSGCNSQSHSQKKKFNSAGNSLAHLVPNKILSSISRRISASSSHELCRCSSCNQSLTPYWRDGWADDVMLCNACGLRFQKFAQRCMYCKYIPRKEDGVEDTCPQCQAAWEC